MQVAGEYSQSDAEKVKVAAKSSLLTTPETTSLDSTFPARAFPANKNAGIRFPIRLKVTLPYLILALIIAVVSAYLVTRVVLDTIEERFTNQLIETRKLASEMIVQEEDRLLETLRLISHTDGFSQAIKGEDSETLREIAYPLLVNSSIEALEIINQTGTSLLSLHHRSGGGIEEYEVTRGDISLQELDIVQKIVNEESDEVGDKFSGLVSASWGDYLYVAGPVFDQNHNLAGIILVGDSLTKVTQSIREATLSQVTIYNLDGLEIDTTFLDSDAYLSDDIQAEIISRQEDESYMRDRISTGIEYKEILAPLEVRSGTDVGFLGTSLAQTFLVRVSSGTKFQILSFAAVSFLFSILAGIFTADRFTRPLLKVVDASSEVAAGNLNISVIPTGNDEVTELTNSFNSMVSSLLRSKSDLVQAHLETVNAYDMTIEGWCKALELRDDVTEGHTHRVTEMTIEIARSLGFGEDELIHVRRGALMHDIGKMAIPDSILKKPGKLTTEEWLEMRKHPQYAYEMLHPISYLRPALNIPYCHHEKWDGSGYPRGLKGQEIPLEARIFAIADVFDALSSDRPYRNALPVPKVLQIIQESRGSHFDPQVVDAFSRMKYAFSSQAEVTCDRTLTSMPRPENEAGKG